MNVNEAKSHICEWGKTLYKAGIVLNRAGCLSVRAGTHLVITPQNVNFQTIAPEELAVIPIEGNQTSDLVQPAQEYPLHAAIYQKKKHNALVHTEQPYVNTASKAGLTVFPMLDDIAQIAGPSIKVAAYHMPIDKKVITSILKSLWWRNAVLLSDAGAICCARTFDDAHAVAQVLEKGCKTVIESTFLGGGKRINAFESYLMHLVYQLKYSKTAHQNQ